MDNLFAFSFSFDASFPSCLLSTFQQSAKMCVFYFVLFFAMLLSFSSETSACKHRGGFQYNVSSICPESNNSKHYIEVDGRHVPFGSRNLRIQLEEPSAPAKIVCDNKFETFRPDGNQVRVTYLTHIVYIQVFWSEKFEGPTGPGLQCVVEAFSNACPGRPSNNHTCVYEVQTSYFSSSTVRKAVEVKTEVALVVEQMAIAEGISRTEERIVVNVYSVDKRSYIAIPAGFRFCSYSEAVSVNDYLAPTGFKWSCKQPTFVQTTKITGRCSDFLLCESRSPCPLADDQSPSGSGKKSANPQPVEMLLALCMIVSSNLANYIG